MTRNEALIPAYPNHPPWLITYPNYNSNVVLEEPRKTTPKDNDCYPDTPDLGIINSPSMICERFVQRSSTFRAARFSILLNNTSYVCKISVGHSLPHFLQKTRKVTQNCGSLWMVCSLVRAIAGASFHSVTRIAYTVAMNPCRNPSCDPDLTILHTCVPCDSAISSASPARASD